MDDDELKSDYASRQPYGEWLDRNLVNLRDLQVPNKKVPDHTKEELVQLQKAFGYRVRGCVARIILPMARNGGEPAGAMGSDTPLAVLSQQPSPCCLSTSSRCLPRLPTLPSTPCARRSSPPPPSMSVPRGQPAGGAMPRTARCSRSSNPILTDTDLLKIKAMDVPGFKIETRLHLLLQKYRRWRRPSSACLWHVDRAYRDGANILILSDRDVDEYHVAIPSAAGGVGAVSKHLVRTRKRTRLWR